MIFSARSRRDIVSALEYHGHPSAPAARFAGELARAFDLLDRFPGILLRRRELTQKDLYFWPVPPFWLVVRKQRNMLELVAVLHAARNLPRLL